MEVDADHLSGLDSLPLRYMKGSHTHVYIDPELYMPCGVIIIDYMELIDRTL